MENISIKILDISEYNGEVRGYSKGVNITIPSVIGYKGWDDEVGSSFCHEVNNSTKEFVSFIKKATHNFEEINNSFPLEAISYNSYKTRNYIDSLKVKG